MCILYGTPKKRAHTHNVESLRWNYATSQRKRYRNRKRKEEKLDVDWIEAKQKCDANEWTKYLSSFFCWRYMWVCVRLCLFYHSHYLCVVLFLSCLSIVLMRYIFANKHITHISRLWLTMTVENTIVQMIRYQRDT